jgi:4-amino-4-deoxy-L-arabinose transferase-like glycosyltransferase
VTQTDNSAGKNKSSQLARIGWIALILATLYICYFHNLGAIGLVGPDEPRYSWIARDMAETGDWVTPRLYGKPWFEKPVLYYWSAALSFKLFGVSEATARLPGAFFALFSSLALAWLAWRVHGPETARWLLLFLPTTVGMIGFSHAAATDMPFSATLTIAMVCGSVVLGLVNDQYTPILPQTPWLALFLFGLFLGLAVLAKGPAALVLSGGAVLLWATLTKRWRDAFRCLHPVTVASFCLTALPWYILCQSRNPDFFHVFIIEHNFKRYLTPEFQHIQPFWFYVPVILIALVPWTLVLLWSAIFGLNDSFWNRRSSSLAFLWMCYAVFIVAFFTISKSKLPGYILPAIPVMVFLVTRAYVTFADHPQKILRWALTAWAILSLPAGLALIFIGRRFHASPGTGQALVVAGCALLAFALANLLLSIKAHTTSPNLSPLAVLPILLLVLMFQSLSRPWLRTDPSGKTLAAEIQTSGIPTNVIYAESMKRGQQYSLSFYLHQKVQSWNPEQPQSGYLLMRSPLCDSLVKLPATCVGEPLQLKASGWFVNRVEK